MNISQEALGDSLNVTEAVVANWENGRTALNKIDSKAKRTLKRWMKDHMV
jgi:DNA-binding transcriptional regulator YiaG